MNVHWTWMWFGLGCFGAIAPEVARWHRLAVRGRMVLVKISKGYAAVSVCYCLIGGVLAAMLAGNLIGSLYIGAAWPVLFSGSKTYVSQMVPRRTGRRGSGDFGVAGSWTEFDLGLFR